MTPAKARKASLASRGPVKTAATSGSRVITILPLAYREAYLFGRARLKSYTGRVSSTPTACPIVFLAFALFICSPLTARCLPCADQTGHLAALGKHYHEQSAPPRLAE